MVSARSRKILGEAHAQLQRGQQAKALGLLESLVAADPGLFDAWLLLGIIEFQRGDAEAARQHLVRATKADPKSPIGWCNLGVAAEAVGRLDESVAAFDRAIQLNTN